MPEEQEIVCNACDSNIRVSITSSDGKPYVLKQTDLSGLKCFVCGLPYQLRLREEKGDV